MPYRLTRSVEPLGNSVQKTGYVLSASVSFHRSHLVADPAPNLNVLNSMVFDTAAVREQEKMQVETGEP